MEYKPGQVVTFYYNGKARLAKVRKTDSNHIICSIDKNRYRSFKLSSIIEPELVGRMDRVWLWLRGVRF